MHSEIIYYWFTIPDYIWGKLHNAYINEIIVLCIFLVQI